MLEQELNFWNPQGPLCTWFIRSELQGPYPTNKVHVFKLAVSYDSHGDFPWRRKAKSDKNHAHPRIRFLGLPWGHKRCLSAITTKSTKLLGHKQSNESNNNLVDMF